MQDKIDVDELRHEVIVKQEQVIEKLMKDPTEEDLERVIERDGVQYAAGVEQFRRGWRANNEFRREQREYRSAPQQ